MENYFGKKNSKTRGGTGPPTDGTEPFAGPARAVPENGVQVRRQECSDLTRQWLEPVTF